MNKDFIYFFILILIIPFRLILSQVDKIEETCPQGMISYWKLDEFGDVSIFTDSYGDHNALVQNNNHPSEDSGIVNSSRFFYNSSAVEVPDNDVYDWGIHTSFSVELWIKTTQPGTGNKVFIGRHGDNSHMAWWLGFGNDNKVLFSVSDTDGVSSTLEGKTKINDGKWHYVVGIRNDSLSVLQLFIDGIEENRVSTFFTGDFSGKSPIYIAYYLNGYHYSGWIDEIAVYKTALSKDQIEKHYNNGLSGKGYCDSFTTDIKNSNSGVINSYILNQNYPNPFNPSTLISFSIPEQENVKLDVYNILGQHISSLVKGELNAGFHNVKFEARNIPSGIYFYKLETNKFINVKKMILQK